MDEELIDRIYEAAALPDLWPSVLDRLNDAGDGYATFLFTVVGKRSQWVGSKNGGYVHDYVAERWPERTDRPLRLVAARHPGFMGDLDVYTREELEREPVFTDFLRPRGLGWGAATAIQVPNGDTLVFDVERLFETGHVDRATLDRLDTLRPHLARAALVSARLAFERVRAAVMALDLIGLPAAVLGPKGQILAANGKIEALIPHVIMDRRERAALSNEGADALLGDAIASAGLPDTLSKVRSIPVAATDENPPFVVHLVPIRRCARDVFTSASAILVVTAVEPAGALSADLLQGLFDLTPAEARVARAIAACQTVETIANAVGVSRETVRTQLKAVLTKTGTRRQADLAVLLTNNRILRT